MKYLTPAIVRAVGTGLPLQNVPDSDIAGLISLSEMDVDSYCSVREDQNLGFSLGSRTEQHKWNPVQRRVYPDCMPVPVRSISSFTIVVSQSSFDGSYVQANIQPNLVVIQNTTEYLEPISLSVIAWGLTPVLAQLTVLQPFCVVTYVAGYTLPKSSFVLINQGGAGTVYHSFLPAWDTGVLPTVSINGVVQLSSTYAVSYLDGTITLATPAQPTDVVTASFTSTIPDVIVQATRLAFQDRAGEYLTNQIGMAGTDQMDVGRRKLRRHDMQAKPTWQRLLDPYRRMTVALA